MYSVFGVVIGEWIGQLEIFKWNVTKDVFLIIPKTFITVVFPTSPEKSI